MADPNVTQEVWIEDLEKLADGSYKRKNYIAKAENGTTLSQHLADDNVIKHKAKTIALEDTANKFTATNVEGAMTELFTNVSNGKQAVGTAITDVDNSVVIPTEPSFADLAGAIGGISTGKKWSSGTLEITNQTIVVSGLPFAPKTVIVHVKDQYNRESIGVLTSELTTQEGRGIRYASLGEHHKSSYSTNSNFRLNSDGFYCSIGASGSGQWIAFE